MSEQANKTPLIDLLRNVPNDFRASWESQWAEDGTPTGHTMSPIGKLCHEAADRIAELEEELAETKEELLSLLESEGLIPEREQNDPRT